MRKNAAAVTTVIPVNGARIKLMNPSRYISPENDMCFPFALLGC
jgi:hypothetical protein